MRSDCIRDEKAMKRMRYRRPNKRDDKIDVEALTKSMGKAEQMLDNYAKTLKEVTNQAHALRIAAAAVAVSAAIAAAESAQKGESSPKRG